MRIDGIVWDYDGVIAENKKEEGEKYPRMIQNSGWLTTFFPGYKMAVFSEEYKKSIDSILRHYGIRRLFGVIEEKKPSKDESTDSTVNALINCIKAMNYGELVGLYAFIGSKEEDIDSIKEAEEKFGISIKFIAFDRDGNNVQDWGKKPDFVAADTKEILNIVREIGN